MNFKYYIVLNDPKIHSWSPRLRLLVAALFLIFIALFGFVYWIR